MKKAVSVISCVLVAASLLLTACSKGQDFSNSQYLGTWKAVGISAFGEEADDTIGNTYLLELKADGTGTFSGEGDDETSTFT